MVVYNALGRDPRVWKEADTLARAGATVDIYMVRGASQAEIERPAPGVTVHRITGSTPTSRYPRTFVRGNAAFARRLRATRHDVYHCHDGATLLLGSVAARKAGAPLVYDAHEYFPGYFPKRVGPAWKTWLAQRIYAHRHIERLFIRRADAVITVNDSIAELLESHYGLGRRPVVLRNTIPYWEPRGDERGLLQEKCGIDAATPTLLYQGMVTPARGLEHAVRALRELPEFHLAILGSPSAGYVEQLRSFAVVEGVADRVSLLEAVPYDQLLPLTASADVGLYLPDPAESSPSYRFSLPNKIFEYTMARIPSVTTRLPEIARTIEEAGIGLTVESPEPVAVAEAVRRVLALSREHLAEALDRGAHQLSWESEESRLLDLYQAYAKR